MTNLKTSENFFIKKYLPWIIFTIVLICCLVLTTIVVSKEKLVMDSICYNFIEEHFIYDSLTPFVKIITFFGSAGGLIAITVILLIFIKNNKMRLTIASNLVIVKLLNIIFKWIVKRPRPAGYRLIDVNETSFPSGHAMVSMAFYGYLIYIVSKYIKNKVIKWVLIILLSLLISLIGLSRIYLGVHFFSDILGGYLISVSYLILFIKITNNKLKI